MTATYNGTQTGTLRLVVSGDSGSGTTAVDSMTVFTMNSPTTGKATVRPTGPDLLGPGTYTQTLTVKACINSDFFCSTNELPGSPQTITVTYVIGPRPAPPDTVMPRVAIAGTPGRVIVRGTALSGTTSVQFGSHAATSITVVSDTEVHANYPALTQGTYSVVLNSGAIPFAGSIVAVPPTNYAADSFDLPEDPAHLSFLRYDAERGALLAGGFYFWWAGIPNKLWRYSYSGSGWNSPQTLVLAGLNDAVLSADGSRILALADDGLIELAADDLSTLHTTPHPNPGVGIGRELLNSIAISNNGIALIGAITQGISGPNPMYYFSTVDRTFRSTRFGWINGDDAHGFRGAQDGSRILGSVRGISPAQPLLNYDASTSLRTYKLASDQRFPAMATRHAQTIVVDPDGFPGHHFVYSSQDETLLGVLPGPATINDLTPRIRLVEVNPQGTRAYVLREDDTLHAYALDQPTVSGAFVEIGSPMTISPPTEAATELIATMTPDGRTLFIGGNRGVLVIPTLD